VSVHGLTEDELDLLADFTAGVLDLADYDRVARLVATDVRGATPHDALVDADRAVRSDLRAIAGPLEMPPDVSARLDTTIAGLADQSRRATLRSVPTQARHAARPAGWRRVGPTLIGVAAAAIVFVVGVGVVTNLQHSNLGSNATAGSGDMSNARGPEAQALSAGPPIRHSGRDYKPGTLGQLAQDQRGAAAPQAPAAAPTANPAPVGSAASKSASGAFDAPSPLTATDPLARLADPSALRACLDAVDRAHAGTPSLVDFAEFQGTPALVIVVQQPNQVIAVVVGPACGQGSANELYSTTIGG
jgi:hypothetical protein